MYEKLTEAAKHTVPDITSRKHHICMFDKGDDTVIHDLKNGEREKFKFMRRIPAKYDSCFILPVYKGYACYLCAVYYDDTDIGGLHRVQINCDIPEENEVREYELVDTLWINRDREVLYEKDGEFTPITSKKELPGNFLYARMSCLSDDGEKSISFMLKNLFRQNSSLFYLDAERGERMVSTPWILREFLFAKETRMRNTKKQKLADQMNSYISEVAFSEDQLYAAKKTKSDIIFSMERIPHGCVMRGVMCMGDTDSLPATEERYRLFFTSDCMICTRKNHHQEFVVTNKMPDYDVSYTSSFDPGITGGTVLDYTSSYFHYFDPHYLGDLIISIFSPHSLIECMLKAGMWEYVRVATCIYNKYRGPKRIMGNMYTIVRGHSSWYSLWDVLGMTPKQLEAILRRFSVPENPLNAFASNPVHDIQVMVMLEDSISSMDSTTFGMALDVYSLILDNGKSGGMVGITCNIIRSILTECSLAGVKKKTVLGYIIGYMKDYKSVGADFYHVLIEYRDYLHMRREIIACGGKGFPLMPTDITWNHNALLYVYNTIKFEIDRDNFLAQAEKCKKYIYEDGDYMVAVPSDPEDLWKEGNFLHHCVGNYTSRMVDGRTNIVFIRKKSAPDKPFFTAEISNDGYVRQIHGFKNRNISTEPCLIPFVKKWIKEKNLEAGNYVTSLEILPMVIIN